MRTYIFGVALAAVLVHGALADDLTTYKRYVAEGGGLGRYLVNLGNAAGDTARSNALAIGLFDYPKYRGTGARWYQMNNGNTNDTPMNTAFSGDVAGDEFVGYKFKKAATVTALVFSDYSYSNDVGGRFAATPRVEVLTGSRAGTWTTAAATWSSPYDTNQTHGAMADYTITLDTPAANVWGVRLAGAGQPSAADASGFIGCRELQVLGEADMRDALLTLDLAMSDDKTEVWVHRQYGDLQNLTTDGDVEGGAQTTWWYDYIAPPHWFGVEWYDAKSNVTAVGWVMSVFGDGGWFLKDTIGVEVQVDSDGMGTFVWTNLISNLDASTYNDVIDDVVAFRTNAPNPGNLSTGFILTFDPISDIYGIRITGMPGGTAGACTGFIAATEFQVFQRAEFEPPLPPELSLPADNAVLNTLQPQFVWQEAQVVDATNIVSYDLMIGTALYEGLTATNYTPAPLAEGDYQWKVRAHDDLGGVSMYSAPRTVTVYSPVYAPDLTTYHQHGMNGVISRYLVNLGRSGGDTARGYTNDTIGLYDYPKVRGNADPWWVMNDGVTDDKRAVTFLHNDALSVTQEFYGYKFKRPATLTSLQVWEYSFGDGGIFQTVPPVVQILAGGRTGTWQDVAAIWVPEYDPTLLDGSTRPYTVTLETPAQNVWGVRLIGDGNPIAADPSGFVACRELKAIGAVDWGVDLSQNLAAEGTPLLVHTNGTAGALNDNNLSAASAVDTLGGPAGQPHWLGVLWDTPRDDVMAAGWVTRFNADGGWLEPTGMAVEYTQNGGATWTPVSNLDFGSYPGDVNALIDIRTNSGLSIDTGFLFVFDPVDGINGLRLSGTPGGSAGFMSAVEFEVFGVVPEPGVLAGLALAGLALARRRR